MDIDKVKNILDKTSIPFLSILLAVLIGSIIMLITGYNPLLAYAALFSGAFGSVQNFANTLANATPLIISGIAIALAFNAGLFNIGAEGQYWIGAIAGVWAGYYFSGLPAYLHIPLALLLAMVAGGLWGGIIPGLAKAYTGAHEVITTMMMSYIATFFSHYLLEGGPMQAEGYIPQSPKINESAMLPKMIEHSQLSIGIVIAVVLSIVVYWFIYKSKWGMEMRIVGDNPRAARYIGINVARNTVVSLGLSGAIAGLAGAVQMLGVQHRLYDSFSSGYGYTAIVVALLARNNPVGIIFSALLFAFLSTGSQNMQMTAGVPAQLTEIISGLIVFFVAAEAIIKSLKNKFSFKFKREGEVS